MKTLPALCLMLTLAFAVSCKQETAAPAEQTTVEPAASDTLHSDEHSHDHSHEGHDHGHDH